MTTRLVATIQTALELDATLVEAHNGIYEVPVDDEVIYTNKGTCSQGFPDDWEIVQRLGRSIGIEPRIVKPETIATEEESGPACPIPNQPPPESECGCGPSATSGSNDSSCCGPGDGKPSKIDGSSGCC